MPGTRSRGAAARAPASADSGPTHAIRSPSSSTAPERIAGREIGSTQSATSTLLVTAGPEPLPEGALRDDAHDAGGRQHPGPGGGRARLAAADARGVRRRAARVTVYDP